MKNIRNIFWNSTRKSTRAIYQQMELALPGSRLTRDEAGFVMEIRRLKAQLARA